MSGSIPRNVIDTHPIAGRVQEGIMGRYLLWVKRENIPQTFHDLFHKKLYQQYSVKKLCD